MFPKNKSMSPSLSTSPAVHPSIVAVLRLIPEEAAGSPVATKTPPLFLQI